MVNSGWVIEYFFSGGHGMLPLPSAHPLCSHRPCSEKQQTNSLGRTCSIRALQYMLVIWSFTIRTSKFWTKRESAKEMVSEFSTTNFWVLDTGVTCCLHRCTALGNQTPRRACPRHVSCSIHSRMLRLLVIFGYTACLPCQKLTTTV